MANILVIVMCILITLTFAICGIVLLIHGFSSKPILTSDILLGSVGVICALIAGIATFFWIIPGIFSR